MKKLLCCLLLLLPLFSYGEVWMICYNSEDSAPVQYITWTAFPVQEEVEISSTWGPDVVRQMSKAMTMPVFFDVGESFVDLSMDALPQGKQSLPLVMQTFLLSHKTPGKWRFRIVGNLAEPIFVMTNSYFSYTTKNAALLLEMKNAEKKPNHVGFSNQIYENLRKMDILTMGDVKPLKQNSDTEELEFFWRQVAGLLGLTISEITFYPQQEIIFIKSPNQSEQLQKFFDLIGFILD